ITVLAFVGDSTLGGTGTVRIESTYVAGDAIRAENGTLTVGPGITTRNVTSASRVVGGSSGGLLNQGTVSSEASARTLQGSGGAAEFRLGGTTRGTLYDALNAGAVQLDGTVRVRLVTGYAPAAGDAFDLLDRTGTFAGTPSFDFSAAALGPGLTWDTTAFPTTGVIQVVPVPEPGAAL